MNSYIQNSSSKVQEALLQRYREIYFDLKSDFRRSTVPFNINFIQDLISRVVITDRPSFRRNGMQQIYLEIGLWTQDLWYIHLFSKSVLEVKIKFCCWKRFRCWRIITWTIKGGIFPITCEHDSSVISCTIYLQQCKDSRVLGRLWQQRMLWRINDLTWLHRGTRWQPPQTHLLAFTTYLPVFVERRWETTLSWH